MSEWFLGESLTTMMNCIGTHGAPALLDVKIATYEINEKVSIGGDLIAEESLTSHL